MSLLDYDPKTGKFSGPMAEPVTKRCADCRDGEHDNYTDDVVLVVVKDPTTGKLVKRSYMCSDHIDMYLSDGYQVYERKGRAKS